MARLNADAVGKSQGMFTDTSARVDTQTTIKMHMPAKVPIDKASLVEIDPDAQE
jgi:hypothetical protein